MVEITCDWCGKKFMREKWNVKQHNYCCRTCLGKANGARMRKKHLKICSNCGQEFEYTGRHGTRNKNFFCSYDCYIAFRSKKVLVRCDWCGKDFWKKASDIARSEHNFCCRDCNVAFVSKQGELTLNHRVNGKLIYRDIIEKELGRPLLSNEEIHHIDGNHRNNDLNNLMIVSPSEHSKIHASWKERDEYGRFVKTG